MGQEGRHECTDVLTKCYGRNEQAIRECEATHEEVEDNRRRKEFTSKCDGG